MTAYKMNVDPDAAEKLANEVGEEVATAVLERVRKKIEYQDSMPKHSKKKSPDWFFGHLAHECRMKYRAGKRDERMSREYAASIAKSREAFEKGFRPDIDSLYGILEDRVDEDKVSKSEQIKYEEFQLAKKFLDSLEEG
ncbi:MAG: hypothetical protein ACXABY_29245 [Candidatus Thorarchaeota archaeon]|jgi:hypothetical protein